MRFLRNLFAKMYGIDKMGYFTIILSFIFSILGRLFYTRFLYLLGQVFMLYSLFRFVSFNKWSRHRENEKFLQLYEKARVKLNQTRARLTDKKNNYFRCPKCKTYLSVPKGVGKVCIVCRKCNHQFVKKSK